jgi:hypothetical protein
MDQSSGHAGAAIFAARGSARHRLVRAGIAASAALLAAWLIALALGVLGGFDSLPGLPSSHPTGSSEVSSKVKAQPPPARAHPSAPVVKTVAPAPASGTSTSRTQSQSSTPKSTAKQVVQPPSSPPVTTSTTQGKGTTRTTGKPVGSPGNGAGGFGAPGQLR